MPLAFGSGRNAAVTAGSSGDQELSYRIGRSLRFNSADSAYLNRTPASAGNRKTWTWSGWVKRSGFGTNQYLFSGASNASNQTNIQFYPSSSSETITVFSNAGAVTTLNLETTQVFRDPSAWYHIVVSIDTTQASSSDRAKLYVNGSQITSFGTATYPTQNSDLNINNNILHTIGAYITPSLFFSGYLTEINFIDGQALTPSSFGETDALTGRWKAKAYSGTYGTNGFYLPFSNNSSTTTQNLLTYSEDFANAAWINYESTDTSNASTAPNGTTTADKLIPNVGSAGGQFYRTYTATDNTTYTFSTYAKPDGFSRVRLYIQKKATSATYAYADYDLSTGTIETTFGSPSATTITSVGNGWYRISISTDVGTGGTSTPTVNIQHLGTTGNGSNGLLIWGAQLEANGTVGPYLYTGASTISSSLRVAQDMSISTGGYNSWVTNNLSVTAGAGNDSLVDSPTNYGTDTGVGGEVRGNYATWNALDSTASSRSNGNLDFSTPSSGWGTTRATIGLNSGKWYWEVTYVSGTDGFVGIMNQTDPITNYVGQSSTSYGYYTNGNKYNNTSPTSYGSSYTSNDVIGVALNLDAGSIVFYKNGVSQGTAYSSIPLTNTYLPAAGDGTNGAGASFIANFGQRPFAYTAPSGFKALCTTNLPTMTIRKPSNYMDVVTYTGNGSTQTISSLGLSPDLVWIKSRSSSGNHVLSDTIRGVNKQLFSNLTDSEGSQTDQITAFNSNGFSLGANVAGTGSVNVNSVTYVAWAWNASGVSATNTNGSITSIVRANRDAGFSIVSYNGNGVSGATIGHGLNSTPKMIIAKLTNSAGFQWPVYHSSLTSASSYLWLNSTNAQATDASYWGTAPTSSVFSVGTNANVNNNTSPYIAYLFAEVEGFSKFGSFTGVASADGPFVYCGFSPKYVLYKSATGIADWQVCDSSRDTFNPVSYFLRPNASNAEAVSATLDFASNGFKLRASTTAGATFIFAAFAESPFKYARAR